MTEKPTRRALFSWALYDWANSAYPTVIVTFVFATYFSEAVAPDSEKGQGLWGLAMGLSGLSVAILAPIIGAIADRAGRRKPWLFLSTLICIVSGAGLWFVEPEESYVLLALILAGAANAFFELGTVFYNAMLPDLASKERIGRLSGWAWGLGYLGGLACLGVTLVLLIMPEVPPFGLDKARAEPVRAVGILVAAWYLLFAWPLFLFTPDRSRDPLPAGRALREGLAGLWRTLKGLRHEGVILRFLIARLFYTDGLNTLFAFGGIYAAGSFGMSVEEILYFGVLLNLTAGGGAFLFAWVDDWIGPKKTILISIGALTALSTAILIVEGKLWFYVLGAAIGIFIGPAQAASRSLMAHLAPPERTTELFGLFALSGKVTSFIGPTLVGWITLATTSQRWGMSAILLLFVIGFILLLPLREPKRA